MRSALTPLTLGAATALYRIIALNAAYFSALPLEKDVGSRGIERRLSDQDGDTNHKNQGRDRRREFPLTPHKA